MTNETRAKLYAKTLYFWLLAKHRESDPMRERVTAGASKIGKLLEQPERWVALHMPRVLKVVPTNDLLTIEWRNLRLRSTVSQVAIVDDRNVRDVFAHWQYIMNKGRSKLNSKRRRAIAARLEQYSVEELKCAIDGCSRSAYHMGDNESHTRYDDIELICRSETHVDRFLNTKKARTNTGDVMDRLDLIVGGLR